MGDGVTTEAFKYLGASGVTAAVLLFIFLRYGRTWFIQPYHHENIDHLNQNTAKLDGIGENVGKVLASQHDIERKLDRLELELNAHVQADSEHHQTRSDIEDERYVRNQDEHREMRDSHETTRRSVHDLRNELAKRSPDRRDS